MTNKIILVVVDPGANEHPVVQRAAWLAQKVGAGLELFICDYDPNIAAGRVSTVYIDKPAREHLLDILKQKLESLAAPLRDAGLDVSTNVSWDHPLVDGIVRKIQSSEPWLVAKDTHHHNILKRTILSNTDWGLIRDCPAPLWLVQPGDVGDLSRIYAAVDPTHVHDKPAELDHVIVTTAREIADAVGAELHVLHSYSMPSEIALSEGAGIGELADAVEEQHTEAFQEFVAGYGLPGSQTHLVQGAPQDVLAEISETGDVDLIVMGAVSRSGLDRVFLGSTAERTLDRLACDLLIVKS
ncbi:MAG TPA: universal stress protein [Gammaproteobacteria bacterium]